MSQTELKTRPELKSESTPEREIFGERQFLKMLALERKRTERSRRRFVLMLLESESLLRGSRAGSVERILRALSSSTRETDVTGWYKEGSTVGAIFTEIGEASTEAVTRALLNKMTEALSKTLTLAQINELSLSFHIYPEDSGEGGVSTPADSALYPDLHKRGSPRGGYQHIKRMMDILGSLGAIVLFLPLLLLIGVLIKLTSRGPILFRQARLGQYGRKFTFLKFRSMRVNNDHTIHEQYVKQFIAKQVGNGSNSSDGKPAIYKLTGDPRVTRIGKFLRRTSLDELPQFLNVLLGDMSLVGPRPPLPYEFEAYDIWHRRRLQEVKPGITGLWQVQGRSRVTFDEMVRLDLRYANTASFWVDVKILLQTPAAVITASGAY